MPNGARGAGQGGGLRVRKPLVFPVAGFCFVCALSTLLCAILLLSIIFVVFDIPPGYNVSSLRALVGPVYLAVFAPAISFLADIIKLLFPWPIVALCLVALIAWGPTEVRDALGRLKMKFAGFEFEGGGQVAEELKKELTDTQKIVERANSAIAEAYESAKAYSTELRDKYDIAVLVSEVATQIATVIGARCPDEYRVTLYIPDFLFTDRLFQFTEYYSKDGRRITEGRAGRVFSVRYGVIGRVWRSGVNEIEGDLITRLDWLQLGPNPTPQDVERFIARRWGLLLEEAVKVRPYNSYGAFRLARADKSLGVLYFDAKKPNAFAEPDELQALEKKIRSLLTDSELTQKLLDLNREVAPWIGRIQIFHNG